MAVPVQLGATADSLLQRRPHRCPENARTPIGRSPGTQDTGVVGDLHVRAGLLGEPARDREEAAALLVDAPLLVGARATLDEAFDLAQLLPAAEPHRGRLGALH